MTVRDYYKEIENGIEYDIIAEGNLVEYYLNDKLHRECGPAVEYISPYKEVREWYIEGKLVPFEFYSRAEYERKLKLLPFW